MTAAHFRRTGRGVREPYKTLLAVSEAIASNRDLGLFHELAGRLRQVARFDYLALVLHDPAVNTLRVHVLEPAVSEHGSCVDLPVEGRPAGRVWQTQQP